MRDILFSLYSVLVYGNREDANCHPAGLGRNSLVACADLSRQRIAVECRNAERWWMPLKARMFMGLKSLAVFLAVLCAGVSLAGCGLVDSAQPDSTHSDSVHSDSENSDSVRSDWDYSELGDEEMLGKDLRRPWIRRPGGTWRKSRRVMKAGRGLRFYLMGRTVRRTAVTRRPLLSLDIALIKTLESFAASSKKRERSKRIWFSIGGWILLFSGYAGKYGLV